MAVDIELIKRCAGIGLTEYQAASVCGIVYEDFISQYSLLFNESLAPDYMRRRWKRFMKYDSDLATRYRKIINRFNQKSPEARIKRAMCVQLSIHCAKRGVDRGGKGFRLLPYTARQLRERLESTFTDKMNWDNYGSYWHIDHKTPVSWFNFKNIKDEEFVRCWSLENLQALPAAENREKGDRWADV